MTQAIEFAPYWVVACTTSRREFLARDHVARLGYEAFLPCVTPRRAARGGRPSRPPGPRPLFPGYLFVRLPNAETWGPVNRAEGVEYILTSGEGVGVLPIGWVEALMLTYAKPRPELFPRGTFVRITKGLWADVCGLVDLDAGDRVKILLDMATGPRAVSVPASLVELG